MFVFEMETTMSGISLDLGAALATTRQPLDTNGDGVVSAEEAAAGANSTRSQEPTVLSDNAASGPSSQVGSGIVKLLMEQSENTAAGGEDTLSIDDILNEVSAIIGAYREAAGTDGAAEDGKGLSTSI
jgi:hypothetical protein